MNKLISIIIPVYNRQDMIGECIASLQQQSYPHFEIILIDDGSTDNTLDVCRKLAAEDARIVLLDGGHKGVSAARNKGLEITRGEYVLFVDSDDVTHPLLLEELLRAMESSDAFVGGTKVRDVKASNWYKVSEYIAAESTSGGFIWKNHEETLKAIFTTSSAFSKIPGTIMRRDWIGQTRFREDLSIGEDFYFIYENLIKGSGSISLENRRYYCRMHDSNTSWDYSYTGFWSRFLRRKLVWENEDAMGRTEYALLQKRQGLFCFLRCLKHNKPHYDDAKKMCQTMQSYRQIIWPALSFADKLRFCSAVYVPGLYLFISRIKDALKKYLKRK